MSPATSCSVVFIVTAVAAMGFYLPKAFVGTAMAKARPVLAVMEIHDSVDILDDQIADSATEYLRGLLARSGQYSVVDKGRQQQKRRAVVKALKRESGKPCFDDECRIELGRELAADTALFCSIGRLGKVCTLTCELTSLETATTESAGLSEFDCGPDGLREALKSVASQLGAGRSGTEVDSSGDVGTPRSVVDGTPGQGGDERVKNDAHLSQEQVTIREERRTLEDKCQRGIPGSCTDYAVNLSKGSVTPEDEATARPLFLEDCAREAGTSCYVAAVMMTEGVGGAQSDSGAAKLFEKACTLEVGDACLKTGDALIQGSIGQRDIVKGVTYLASACRLGSIGGCVGAGWFLFGDGEDEKAAIINDRVCQSMGEIASLGCFNRATQLLYVERNWQEGLKMLGYACEKGFGSACIQRATLVQSQPEDALHAKASGELDATASWCSEGRDGEACLNVAEWFAYKGKRAKAFEYMTLAKKFLSAKCQEGHKPDCRIMKLRLREQ